MASFHWQWLNHNILSTDMPSHGIQLWPIAKQQGYLWLSLIGWSLSTKLKGHIPGTRPEAETGSSRFTLLPHSCSGFSPLTDYLLCCVTLSLFLFLPSCSFSTALPNYHSLVPLLCNCIWKSKAGPLTSRGHHSSVAYILVLHLHGHHASNRVFFSLREEIWRLVKTISTEPYGDHLKH